MIKSTSPIELWDAYYECEHGRLPQQNCRPCGRVAVNERVDTYPGVQAIVQLERKHVERTIR